MKVSVTKEILEQSKNCNANIVKEGIGFNCAISIAIRELLPTAWVTDTEIIVLKNVEDFYEIIVNGEEIVENGIHGLDNYAEIKLPEEGTDFVHAFDNYSSEKRVAMEPISFDIEIPDSVLETIGDMEEVNSIIANSKTLELV